MPTSMTATFWARDNSMGEYKAFSRCVRSDDARHPKCPYCGDDSPMWVSQSAAPDGRVTFLWECTECGHEFETHYHKHKPENA